MQKAWFARGRPISSLLVAGLSILLWAAYANSQGLHGFVGSWECRECHEKIYLEWKKTPHARMLRNAIQDPDAIEATNFEGVPFSRRDIYFSIGSHWIQKYTTLLGGQFYVLPRYWNIAKVKWEPYSIFDWRQQPYPLYCNGCHAVGFDLRTRTYAEEAIGCESCHGPGEKHVDEEGDKTLIVNPAKLSWVRRNMICEACHTDGRDLESQTVPFPAGFIAGQALTDFYTDFFMPKPKSGPWTKEVVDGKPVSKGWYWGTMDYFERHRMFMFYQSKFYATDRACEVCKFEREATARYLSRSEYCGSCHREIFPRFADHAMHKESQAECPDCHTPTVTADGSRYSIHDHRFDFSRSEIPCFECHGEDMAGKAVPERGHDFHIQPVKMNATLTLAQACSRCHPDKDQVWVETQIERIRKEGFRTAGKKQGD